MTEDEKPEDEDPPLGWPRGDRPENPKHGLFVSDAELYRRLGVGPRTGRIAVSELERSGQFPKKDPLFGNKRYWPAVVAKLNDRYIHIVSPINPMPVPGTGNRPRPLSEGAQKMLADAEAHANRNKPGYKRKLVPRILPNPE